MRKACMFVLLAGCGGIRDVEFGIEERPSNVTCVPPTRPVPGSGARLERVFPELAWDRATTLARPATDALHWYVTEQHTGRIHRFAIDPGDDSDVVLDIGDRLGAEANEAGLLGIAFHPSFATNGQMFVSYNGVNLTSTLSRFTSTDGGATFDPDTEEILLTVDQPFSNHKGGNILFGPDGYLYWGLGDGGSAGDPGNRAQDTGTLLGKMLRIDVDNGTPYGIPADNPFVGTTGRDEIYAFGLRNPYRFAFDSANGDLWVGDVGQDTWEEVDLVTLGGNYGWRVMEGPDCFNPPNGCNQTGLVQPIAWYPIAPGGGSVIMGPVYHGQAIEGLAGAPIYSDFYTGDVWALISDGADGYDPLPVLEDSGHNIAHWAQEPNGEFLALTFSDGIWRLLPDGVTTPDPTPPTLSATGCVDPEHPDEPAPGLVPYGVALAFWSDGADKRRWMALPDGEAATVGPDGDLDFPPGTVLVKEMTRDGRPIETRLFIRWDDGQWGGLTYAWREDGTDADLVDAAGASVDLDPEWALPSRSGCLQCHTEAAGRTLGLELQQLAGTYVYPKRRRADQIATLEHLGLIEGVPEEIPDRLPVGLSDAPLEDRARAWLHVNCAGCHRPEGTADIDLRMHVPFEQTGLCAAPQRGDLEIADARIVAPGEPARSVLLARASRRDDSAMPPLASNIPDPLGIALLDAWIAELPANSCD